MRNAGIASRTVLILVALLVPLLVGCAFPQLWEGLSLELWDGSSAGETEPESTLRIDEIVANSLEAGASNRALRYDKETDTYVLYPYGRFHQDVAVRDLSLVNEARAQAKASQLTWSAELEDIAKRRAVESAVYWDHERPNGLEARSLWEDGHGYWNESEQLWYSDAYEGRENLGLATYLDMERMHREWMASSGHHETMMFPEHQSFACAVYECNGNYYYVEAFSSKAYASAVSDESTSYSAVPVHVLPERFSLSVSQPRPIVVKRGESVTLNTDIAATVFGKNLSPRLDGSGYPTRYVIRPQDIGQFWSEGTSVARVYGYNTVVGVAPGTTRIMAEVRGDPQTTVSFTVTVEE